MNEIKLPSWEECEEVVKLKMATSLEVFIYHNEPAGKDDIRFRQQLKNLVDYISSIASAGEAFFQNTLDFHPRAAKLMFKRKDFIVIAHDEPYFIVAYEMIRQHEKEKGTWSDDDETQYMNYVTGNDGET